MAGYSDQVLKLEIPGELPITIEAHYDVEIEPDGDGPTYTVDLGYVDWTLAGRPMYTIEGSEIPPAMRDKILAAITVSDAEMREALNVEADWEAHKRDHAPGMI